MIDKNLPRQSHTHTHTHTQVIKEQFVALAHLMPKGNKFVLKDVREISSDYGDVLWAKFTQPVLVLIFHFADVDKW